LTSRSSFSGILLCLLAPAAASAASTSEEEYARAAQLVGQRHAGEAIPILERVIAQAPGFYRAYGLLVNAYLQKHAPEPAAAYFAALLRDPERSAFAHYALGQIDFLGSNFSGAVDHYATCVQQRPDSVPCYVPLADSLILATGRSATAEDLAARIPGNREGPYSCLAFTRFLLQNRKVSEGLKAAQRCLAQAETLGQIDFLVAAHNQMAEAYGSTGGDHDQPLKHNLEAARLAARLGDPEAAFFHKLRVCSDYFSLGRHAEAQECFGQVETAGRSQGNRSWLELSLLSIANAHKSHGDLEQALAEFAEAAGLYQGDDDFEQLELTLLEIGKIHFVRGDLQQSRRFCEESLALTRAHGPRAYQAYALRELSKVYSVSGDPILALRFANESIAIFRELGKHHQAGAGVGNLPEIYAFMGDWPSALRYARESLQSAIENEDMLERQDTLAIVGDVLLGMGQYREAAHSFQQSLALDGATRFAPFLLTGLMGLGSAYLALREYGHAEARLRESLQLARELGNRRAEANALAQLGRCYRQLGSLQKAREYFGTALELARRIPLVEVTLIAQRGLADLAMRSGNFHQALEHLESAAENVESLRSRIPTADLKADFGRENSRLYEDLLYVLAQLDRREPGKGWDRQAFDYAERGRARAFLDLLAESRAQITKGLPAEQWRQRNELEAALSRAMAALIERESDANRRAAALAERRLADWITSIGVTNPQYEALRYPRPSNAAQAGALSAALGATILEYALGDRESYLWVVTPGRVRCFRLPGRAAVERAVTDYRKLIAQRPQGAQFDAWQAPAEALYNMLVKPAEEYLARPRPLVIVPDGILHYLPFETLRAVGPDDRGIPSNSPQCLIERFATSYMPSVSVLAELEQRAPEGARKFDLLAYGDPVFSRPSGFSRPGGGPPASVDLVRGIYESAGIRFPPLPNTRREVEAIGRLFPKERHTTFLGLDATEASVKQTNLLDYHLLHFATHAIVDDRNPTRSGIVLSLVNSGDEDGILRMNEVFNLEMNADLVVLSACQTGLGNLVRGEGMVGLTRAFLYAGARRVAVSLWDVNDLTAPEFMLSFYGRLRQGEAPAAALRAAKVEMLHSGSAVRANPYFWAPFVLEAAPDPIAKKN
jgi:CHAT domain-containing protein/lipopolysaccharide biosynthesis regulator YciM